MLNYKIKFTENEINIFNSKIESDKTRAKIMSIYSYIVKNSENNKLTISFSKFHKKYSRYHFNMCLTYFKKLINRLEELQLISINKENKCNTYFINGVTEKVTNENITESIETTRLEYNLNLPKNKIINKDIDKDISTKSENKINYNSLIENEKKCTSLIDVRVKTKELLKKYRVRNKSIQNYVLVTITKFYRNVTVKFLENYIIKLISKARIKYYADWNSSQAKKVHVIKTLKCANFSQRQYNYDSLEKQLLGEEEYNLNTLYI